MLTNLNVFKTLKAVHVKEASLKSTCRCLIVKVAMWFLLQAITAVPHLHKESTHVQALFPAERRLLLLLCVYEKGL